MVPTTLSKTVTAIVERSGEVRAPFQGVLVLEAGYDGRYRLVEDLVARPGQRRGVVPRGMDGGKLPADQVLSRDEAERAVRTLLGLDKRRRRHRADRVSSDADI
jgi:hypothetical protein